MHSDESFFFVKNLLRPENHQIHQAVGDADNASGPAFMTCDPQVNIHIAQLRPN